MPKSKNRPVQHNLRLETINFPYAKLDEMEDVVHRLVRYCSGPKTTPNVAQIILYSLSTPVKASRLLWTPNTLLLFSVGYQPFQFKFFCISDLLTVCRSLPWHLHLPIRTTIDSMRYWTFGV